MDINHEIIINAFTLESVYSGIEKAYSFSKEKDEEVSFSVFIDELLERYGLVENAGSYIIKDGEIDEVEETFRDLARCERAVGKKPRIDIYDKNTKEYWVYTYLEKNEVDVERVLSLSATEYYINDYNRLQEIEDDLEKTLKEYKSELIKDPYGYYGVSRRDF